MSSDAPHLPAHSQQESPAQPLSQKEPHAQAPSHEESPALPLSQKEPHAQAPSQWLQLMLAEIHAKREAHERGRAEDERRRAEAGGTEPS